MRGYYSAEHLHAAAAFGVVSCSREYIASVADANRPCDTSPALRKNDVRKLIISDVPQEDISGQVNVPCCTGTVIPKVMLCPSGPVWAALRSDRHEIRLTRLGARLATEMGLITVAPSVVDELSVKGLNPSRWLLPERVRSVTGESMSRYVLWQQVGGSYTSSNVCYSHSDGGTLPYIPLELESAAGYYLGIHVMRSAGERFSTIDWLRPPCPDSSHETSTGSRLFTPRTSVLHSPDARLVSGRQGIGHLTTSNTRQTPPSKAMSPYILGNQGRWQRPSKSGDPVAVSVDCTRTVKALNLDWT